MPRTKALRIGDGCVAVGNTRLKTPYPPNRSIRVDQRFRMPARRLSDCRGNEVSQGSYCIINRDKFWNEKTFVSFDSRVPCDRKLRA